MYKFTLSIVLNLVIQVPWILMVSGETPGVVSTSCCSNVFLSSSATLAKTQSGVLGIFTLSSQKIANNPHPVYIKQSSDQDYYLYFRQSGKHIFLVTQP